MGVTICGRHAAHKCLVCGSDNAQVVQTSMGGSGTQVFVECPDCKSTGKIGNIPEWRGIELTKAMLAKLFEAAEIQIIGEPVELKNRYWGGDAHPWWHVKTALGWMVLGWRKRVMNIEWGDTGVEAIVTERDVTKGPTGVHAYSDEEAIEDMKVFGVAFRAHQAELKRTEAIRASETLIRLLEEVNVAKAGPA
jgi:hypothetical protein